MTLEPRLILFVEAPTLIAECLGSEVLLVGTLAVIEEVE
jgi:hypothetical protein